MSGILLKSLTGLKFIADGMLGRLSRWLRMLGCDVKYCNQASDKMLLMIADEENRVLLTRDRALFQKANVNGIQAFFVAGESGVEKLADMAQHFDIQLKIDTANSRCPVCGSSLREVEKAAIVDRVPAGTLKHHKEFWLCTGCDKVYWEGSHWKKMNETLNKAKTLIEKEHT